jgi:hypothetical protein
MVQWRTVTSLMLTAVSLMTLAYPSRFSGLELDLGKRASSPGSIL